MRETTKLNVGIDEFLLNQFDRLIELKRYSNRSEATRCLIRDSLFRTRPEHVDKDDKEMVGTVALLYDHHGPAVSEKLTRCKDAYSKFITNVLNVHLDDQNSLEVLVVRGETQTINRIANELIRIKGIKNGNLVMIPAGDGLN